MSRTADNRERWKRQILDLCDETARPLTVRQIWQGLGPGRPATQGTVRSLCRELVATGELFAAEVLAELARGKTFGAPVTRPSLVLGYTTLWESNSHEE